MRIQAHQAEVSSLSRRFRQVGCSADGWDTTLVDDATGHQWRRTYLGSTHHGGGLPILVREPLPSVDELLALAGESPDLAEMAAAAWMLAEADREGAYKTSLIAIAEHMVDRNEHSRAVLLVHGGQLDDETNLRSAIGRPMQAVVSNHAHFEAIAARARRILDMVDPDARLGGHDVFGRDQKADVGIAQVTLGAPYRDVDEAPESDRRWTVLGIDDRDDIGTLPPLEYETFTLVLAADARTVPDEALRAPARHWLTAGARVVCAWGPACGRVHDAFDEAALALGLNHENAVVNTTWHQGEALREVVWFAIHTIAPDEAYPDADDALVAIAVGSKGWEAEMRAYLRAGALIVDQT